MKNEEIRRRIPPPPLFTIRPPPKPPGPLFEKFQSVEILNGQCVRPSLNIFNSSSSLIDQRHEPINWFNFILLFMAIFSVICFIVIAIFIYICLKKLKKEEKQYRNYLMAGSMSLRNGRLDFDRLNSCGRISEHYKCTSNAFHCCDDYHSHQLISSIDPANNTSTSSNHQTTSTDENGQLSIRTDENHEHNSNESPQHQYESIPEYLLTMNKEHHHHHHYSPLIYHQFCQQTERNKSIPYTSISRSYLLPRPSPMTENINRNDSGQCKCPCSSIPSGSIINQEESSAPLLPSTSTKESQKIKSPSTPKSLMVGWTRRTSLSSSSSSSSKRKANNNDAPNEQRHGFFSHFKKPSVFS